MVTLTFAFNKDKVKEAGCTENELLQPMREHAEKYGIEEKEYGVFSKDGEDALCVLTMFVSRITRKDRNYINYFESWTLDVDGEKEDCIAETLKWYRKKEEKNMEQKDMPKISPLTAEIVERADKASSKALQEIADLDVSNMTSEELLTIMGKHYK